MRNFRYYFNTGRLKRFHLTGHLMHPHEAIYNIFYRVLAHMSTFFVFFCFLNESVVNRVSLKVLRIKRLYTEDML